jgi:flagellar hook-basal body complex protein FliE
MPITNIPVSSEIRNIGGITRPKEDVASPGFAEQLKTFVKSVNTEMANSEKISADFAAGRINNIHETMLASEKAAIAFRLVGSIRERVLEAYHEVMRMPM